MNSIRPYRPDDFKSCLAIINDGAQAYKGVIPSDRWHEPYMTREYLQDEIEKGVRFWVYEEDGIPIGVMGIQNIQDVTLIRHAYVRTAHRQKGIGGKLLTFLMEKTERPILIGTWASAHWAIRFYEKYGFKMVSDTEKNLLLRTYWSIPERQVETSVVLVDEKWPKV